LLTFFVQRLHPDRAGDSIDARFMFQQLAKAYAVLSVDVKRSQYNAAASHTLYTLQYPDEFDTATTLKIDYNLPERCTKPSITLIKHRRSKRSFLQQSSLRYVR
jgi:DnaJ-class molecular chaperone